MANLPNPFYETIKNNATELQDALLDMQHWEKDIKEEDNKLLKNQKSKNSDAQEENEYQKALPIRGIESNQVHKEMNNAEKESKNEVLKGEKAKRISAYDYAAWDKYTANVENEPQSDEDKPTENPSPILSNKEKANKFKDEGNDCYTNGKLKDAVAKYTQGIALDPSNKLLFANRAMAYIKLNNFKAAENDCSQCLKQDPKYIKAYLRRATSRYHLNLFSKAMEDYSSVLQMEPWNKDAKRELEKLKILHYKEKRSSKSEEPTASINLDAQKGQSSSENFKGKKIKINEVHSSKQLLELEKELDPQSSNALKMPVPVPIASSTKDVMKPKPIIEEKILPKPLEVTPFKLPEPTKPKEVPAPPKNSRQFELDWEKVFKYPELARLYLESIPGEFFKGIEIEVDLLVQIVNHLKNESFDAHFANEILLSIEKSRGFYLNLAFLEPDQKLDVRNLLEAIERQGINNEFLQKISKSL